MPKGFANYISYSIIFLFTSEMQLLLESKKVPVLTVLTTLTVLMLNKVNNYLEQEMNNNIMF